MLVFSARKFRAVLCCTLLFYAGISIAELSEKRKAELDRELSSKMAAREVEVLAKTELEIARLSSSDREVSVLMAAALLNPKIDRLAELKFRDKPLSQQQVAYIASVALTRLSLLAQIGGLQKAVLCHRKESKILLNMSQGKSEEPANCRHLAYDPKMQSHLVENANAPQFIDLKGLASQWASSAIMYAYHLAVLDQFGASVRLEDAPKKQGSNVACEEQIRPIKDFPLEMQDATLLHASNVVVNKFLELNSKGSTKPEEQLFGYKILAIGNYLLKLYPVGTSKVKYVLGGLSDAADQMIRGAISYEKFVEQFADFYSQLQSIEKTSKNNKSEFIQSNKAQIESLSKCVVVAAMYSAAQKAAK